MPSGGGAAPRCSTVSAPDELALAEALGAAAGPAAAVAAIAVIAAITIIVIITAIAVIIVMAPGNAMYANNVGANFTSDT